MAKQVNLSATLRPELGKGASGRLRRDGRVPAIMYGHDVQPTALSVDSLELYHVLHTEAGGNAMIRLDIAGEVHLTVAREIQRHPVRGDYSHVDFLAVDKDQPISVEVPLHILGAEKVTGVVQGVLPSVPIKVKPLEIPTSFDVDVSTLTIGDVVRVEDLDMPEGSEPDIDPHRTIITVNAPQGVETGEEEEEAEGELAGEVAEAPAAE